MALPHTTIPSPQARNWLALFFEARHLSQPDGRPLRAYRVTESEYAEMRTLLQSARAEAHSPLQKKYWAAVFCLFIAECYRREYDASGTGWSWSTFERRIDQTLEFSPLQHLEFTEYGLERYWRRSIRYRDRGRDLLGSLFAEGGLPWPLLQDETHGFGRCIRAGLRNYYRAGSERRSLLELMGDTEYALPQAFRTTESRQLRAGIVQQLMYLAESYPLHGQADPSAFLDQQDSGWRDQFPIPLDAANGKKLLNEWLKDAGQRRLERAVEVARTLAFSCTHYLRHELPDWSLATDFALEDTLTFGDSSVTLRNTRLELAFFEGDQLLARAGAVYVQRDQHGWSTRFPRTHYSVARQHPERALSLRFLDSGLSVHQIDFDDSSVDYQELPLVFVAAEERWQLVASSSRTVAADRMRVRLPSDYAILTPEHPPLTHDAAGGIWLDSDSTVRCQHGTDVFVFQLGDAAAAHTPGFTLKGRTCAWDSTPGLVFAGWPRLEILHADATDCAQFHEYVDGRPLKSVPPHELVGTFRYSVKGADGETVLRRRFAVVPEHLTIALRPGNPARVRISHAGSLRPQVLNDGVQLAAEASGEQLELTLTTSAASLPSRLQLRLQPSTHQAPIDVRLPFPYQGAFFLDARGNSVAPGRLIIEDLLGACLVLLSGRASGQLFELQLEMFSKSLQSRPWRRYCLQAGEAPLTVNLFNYQHDIIQMLAVVSDQDAYVRIQVAGRQHLLTLDVYRYQAYLVPADPHSVELVAGPQRSAAGDIEVLAMRLSAPEEAPLTLTEHCSEQVPTGRFMLDERLERNGPWLLLPAAGSRVKFRPSLYQAGEADARAAVLDPSSLQAAVQLFHPVEAPDAMAVPMTMMAADFNHPGWQYLTDLSEHYAHVPLSTFQAWIALAHDHAALSAAIFRLELDSAFCERLRDELAIVWECVAMEHWLDSYARCRQWLASDGLSENYTDLLIKSRLNVFGTLAPGFAHLGPYLKTRQASSLPKLPPLAHILPGWYQILRQVHAGNQEWPQVSGTTLSTWMRQHAATLPDGIASLSNIGFSDAVTYLPIFMAHVTTGRAELTDLIPDTGAPLYALQVVADFDRAQWYDSVYALFVCYLLARV